MPARLYLDHNATSPLRPQARAAFLAAMEHCGNASSVHAEGRAARAIVENARGAIAGALEVGLRQVVFTSGATEAANAAVAPSLRGAAGLAQRLIVGATEHACVYSGHRFPADCVGIAPVDARGVIDPAALDDLLALPGQALVAIHAANNETGVVQPLAALAERARPRGAMLVCDAVQMAGKADISPARLGADVVFFSSHKLGGPMGAGALVFASDALRLGEPLIRGGGQEGGARAGTENVAAIAGFAAAFAAAVAAQDSEAARLQSLRDSMEQRIEAAFAEVVFFGAGAPRLPNTSAFALPDLAAETLLMALDIDGVAISSGSACSSGKVRASHVLAAMGVEPHITKGALRVSLGWTTSADDIDRFCETLQRTVRNIRARRAGLSGARPV